MPSSGISGPLNIAVFGLCLTLTSSISRAAPPLAHPRVLILGALSSLTDSGEATRAAALLQTAGFAAKILSAEQLSSAGGLSPNSCEAFVVPHADRFPAILQPNLLRYLNQGGRVLCVDGPPFTVYAYKNGTAWSGLSDRLRALPYRPLLDFRVTDLKSWSRATSDPLSVSNVTREPLTREAVPDGAALHFRFERYSGWDNFGPPAFRVSPFRSGADLTTFWARGDAKTRALVMEWREHDGSRWMRAVKLSQKWERYVLTPAEFAYWPDSSSRGRGESGDRFQPDNAAAWRVGLAESHAAQSPGAHQFWIAGLGCAALPPDVSEQTPPTLECLSPVSKLFQTGGASARYWSPVVRNRGVGMVGDRSGRLIRVDLRLAGKQPIDRKLIDPQSVGRQAVDRTTPLDLSAPIQAPSRAWIYLGFMGPYAHAAWGDIASGEDLTALLVPTLRKLTQNQYLTRAGVDKPYYHTGEPVTAGAAMVGRGAARRVRVDISVDPIALPLGPASASNVTTGESVLGDSHPVDDFTATFADLVPGEYVAHITLRSIGSSRLPVALLDRIDEPFRIVPTERFADQSGRVTVRGAEFLRDGKPWRPVGINYWPLWIAGQDSDAYRLHWLSPEQYDPELVEHDLTLCRSLGVNLISIQYTRPEEAPALNDVLARCRNHGLLANVFVAGGDPLAFDAATLRSLVDAADLRDNPTVFAFDVAWEPHVGRYEQRRRLDPEWREWIARQYGGAVNATNQWSINAPLDREGLFTNPSDEMLSTDGPWRIMVAAYRRFLDDRISIGYRRTAELLRPYGALIGARSGYGGNGYIGVAGEAPYDLLSGAAHLDFISPEGYALNGKWEEFRAGGLTTAYARWAGAGKPVFWAEFGLSIYPNPDGGKIAAQGDYYDKFYRMIVDSGANGSSAWWYPGGLRVDENSDFGLISPDGVPRIAALRLKRHAASELPASKVNPAPDAWITVDRDADARGYAGIFARWRAEFGKLRSSGRIPGVRTEATGMTLETMPLTAVGNVAATGPCPLKYVNAELELSADSKTVTVTNTGDIAWSRGREARSGDTEIGIILQPNQRILELTAKPRQRWLPITASVPRYGSTTINVNRLLALAPGETFIAGTVRVALIRMEGGREAVYFFGEALSIFR